MLISVIGNPLKVDILLSRATVVNKTVEDSFLVGLRIYYKVNRIYKKNTQFAWHVYAHTGHTPTHKLHMQT